MRTPRTFRQRLNVIAQFGFGGGIAYVAFLYVSYGLWSRPLGVPAWACYLLATGCMTAFLVSAGLRIAVFVAATASAMALLAFEVLLEVRRVQLENAFRAEVATRTGVEPLIPGRQPPPNETMDPDLRGIRCTGLATGAVDKSLLPLAGWPHKRTLLGNELGYDVIYVADRFGFNNPDEVHDKRGGRAGVVIVGDSFAQGVAVQPEGNAAGILRRHGYDVLNLGCAGNGPLSELAAYREYGSRFAPDVVVWFYLESNDLANLASESRTLLNAYLRPGFTQDLANRGEEVVQFLDRLETPQSRSLRSSVRVLRLANTGTLVSRLLTSQRELVDKLRQVTGRLHDEVTADGARLVVVYLPDPNAVARGSRDARCFFSAANCKPEVLEMFAERSIPVIDFEAKMAGLDDPLEVFPFRVGRVARGHYTEAGYALLGESIADELSALGF